MHDKQMGETGIYIHIPFCLRKCPYCDFYSVAETQLGKTESASLESRFVTALCRETEAAGRKYGRASRNGEERQADTIYFGGGTPSLLSSDEMGDILTAVRKSFSVADDAEISIECNPVTASGEKLKAFRELGINRLSIGAQSCDDNVQRTLGRLHNPADITRTVEEAQKAGFDNISLDLMFAIPGQTEKSWEQTLEKALEPEPQHISFYSLEFMEGTPFADRLEKGRMRETDAEADRRMYERCLEILTEAGFNQYEISNASKGEEYICRHNMKYWSLEEYLGFGPSAHSYMIGADGRGQRTSNMNSLERYLIGWEKSGAAGESAVETFTENSLSEDVCEYVFTGLRKNKGINLRRFRNRFGKDLWEFYGRDVRKEFEDYVSAGFASESDGNIRLTVKGMNISSRIMALFV